MKKRGPKNGKHSVETIMKMKETKSEGTIVKYQAFLLNLYHDTRKPLTVHNVSKVAADANLDFSIMPVIEELKLISSERAKNEKGIVNKNSGRILKWIGERPTEETARRVYNAMNERRKKIVAERKKREAAEKKETEPKVIAREKTTVQLPLGYEEKKDSPQVDKIGAALTEIGAMRAELLQTREVIRELAKEISILNSSRETNRKLLTGRLDGLREQIADANNNVRELTAITRDMFELFKSSGTTGLKMLSELYQSLK